ncbi:MAG: hypothetical protein ABW042_03230, partial [Phenylobacterium sp.]
WAMLETRNLRISQPRAGDVVATIAAEIMQGPKFRNTRRWLFNRTSGALAQITDTVSVALDLEARRPTEIPEDIRVELDSRRLPEWA